MIQEILEEIRRKENVRGNLSALRAECREEAAKKEIVSMPEAAGLIMGCLKEEDAKARKNAALLLGELGIQKAGDALYEAYRAEGQLFVKSSYLTALLEMETEGLMPFFTERYQNLCAYQPGENEKKHITAELRALEAILRKSQGGRKHAFCGQNKEQTILLTTNPLHREITARQIKQEKRLTPLGVKIKTEDLEQILPVRTYRELLYPIALKEGITIRTSPEKLGLALAESDMAAIVMQMHNGEPPFYFRIALKIPMDKEAAADYIKRGAGALEEASGRTLLNSTSDYELEIRLLTDKTGKVFAFLKLYTIRDARFIYRRQTIAASIRPYEAALMAKLAEPYLTEQAQVLDPFCGVGTMLVERYKIIPAGHMYGIDTFGEAIEKARENTKAAGVTVNYIHRDYFDFTHEYLFDEIFTNLPSRGKKTKEEADRFYGDFFRKSRLHLKKHGILMLYSNEMGFVKKYLRLMPEYALREEYCMNRKSQSYFFIIELKEN